MIFRVRLEGGAASSDELEKEFRALASQVAHVAYLEGISGREMLGGKSTIESRKYGDDLVKIGSDGMWFDWVGRHTFEMKVLDGEDQFLQPHDQPDYSAAWTPTAYETTGRPMGGYVHPVAAGEPMGEPQEQPFAIVLLRQNGVPGKRSGMAHIGASRLLADITGWPGVRYVRPDYIAPKPGGRVIGDEGMWRVVVSFKARDDLREVAALDDLVIEHSSLDEAAGLAYQALLDAGQPTVTA